MKEKIDRNSYAYKKWKSDVLDRDGRKCVRCGETKNLEAHHIQPYALFPELAIDINNGITLCRTCHSQEHNKNYGKDQIITDKISSSVHPFFLNLRKVTFYISYRMDILRKFWKEFPLPRDWKKKIEKTIISTIILVLICFLVGLLR